MQSVYVARHPIYDRQLNIFGYELLFRATPESKSASLDGDEATSQVLAHSLMEIGLDRLTDGRPAFVNLTRKFLVSQELELPREALVLEVLENIEVDAELINSVRRLRDAGYRIALDDFAFEDRWKPLLDLVHFIKLDVPLIPPDVLRRRLPELRGFGCKLLAEKVETQEEFDRLRELPIDLFQGYFFCKPKVVEAKKVNSNQAALFRLLALLQKPEVPMSELESIIARDAALGYKLLKYLNSAHLGLVGSRFRSVGQAIGFLGIRQLRTWISMLALSGIQKKPAELARTSLRRARQCEQYCLQCGDGKDPDAYFLVGLFSLLDALLDLPVPSILEQVPVSSEISAALLRAEAPIGPVLAAVVAWEQGNFEPALALPRRAGSPPLADVFLQSLLWADEQIKLIG